MTCKKQEFFTVIQGEERDLPIKFVQEDGSPYVLNAPDEIKVRFKKADESILEKKLTLAEVVITSDPLGEVTVKLQEADTALLKVGDRLDFAADVTKGTVTRKVFFKRGITVLKDFS